MLTQYKNLISKIIFFALIFVASEIFAANTAPNASAELAQLLNNIHTMQATFKQSLVNSNGEQIGQKTIGSMMLERPGKFRWKITQPNNQLIILNKNKSLLYDADLEQVVKRKVDYYKPGNPAMLLSSTTESLTQSFKITKLKKSGRGLWFKLTPKSQKNRENVFQWIKIHFINDNLNEMQIADNLEQKSIINFGNVILNPQISPNMFVFTPPKNTEVFDEK